MIPKRLSLLFLVCGENVKTGIRLEILLIGFFWSVKIIGRRLELGLITVR